MLRITIGLPGAGKTTDALAWVKRDPTHRARINRDDLRDMLHGGYLGTRDQEEQVTAVRDVAILKLLRSEFDVVADDTNLRWQHVERLRRIATRVQTTFEIVSYLDVGLEVCLERDRVRTRTLGPRIIKNMWANSLRDMIDNWRSRIVDDLRQQGHQDVDQMIEKAVLDPIGHEDGPVVRLARSHTDRQIDRYAPIIWDAA